MTTVDRWLLPDGIEEVLPATAARVEQLRRVLLDRARLDWRRRDFDLLLRFGLRNRIFARAP